MNNQNNNNKGKSGLKYLYYGQNDEQIEFYLAHGLKPVKEGVHFHTGNRFVAFPFDESGRVWHLWKEHTQEEWKQGKFRNNK